MKVIYLNEVILGFKTNSLISVNNVDSELSNQMMLLKTTVYGFKSLSKVSETIERR